MAKKLTSKKQNNKPRKPRGGVRPVLFYFSFGEISFGRLYVTFIDFTTKGKSILLFKG